MASKTYSLTAKFNGETYRKRTDDLNETIKALQPAWLHTDVDITVKKDKQEAIRHISLIKARRLFNDDVTREVFINNLFI